MKDYELVIIIDPRSQDEKKAVEKIKKIIVSLEGEVNKITSWGKLEFVYPIKNTKQGNYYLLNVSLPSYGPGQFEKKMRLEQEVLRYLLIIEKEKSLKNKPEVVSKKQG